MIKFKLNRTQKRYSQKAFDKALNHIRKQGKPSYNAYGECSYRVFDDDDDGDGKVLGCAFAPMIKEYNSRMEGNSAKAVVEDYPDNLFKWVLSASPEFLNQLQLAHDTSADPSHKGTPENPYIEGTFIEQFEKRMENLAEKFDLVYST